MMGRRYLGYNKRSRVRFTRPTQIIKKQIHRVMFNMTDDEYKLLLEQNTKPQQNKVTEHHACEEIKRVKLSKVNFDDQVKSNRIISLDSDLQLNSALSNTNRRDNNCKVLKVPLVQDRIVIDLKDYLTLNEKSKKVNILKVVNSANKKVVHNNESFINDSKKAKSNKIERNKVLIEDKSLDPMNNNLLVAQIPNDEQTYEPHEKIQQTFILVPQKINTNNNNSIIVQQPVVKQQTPVISNISNISSIIQKISYKPIKPKPTVYPPNSTGIQQKSVILPQPIFLQPKPVIINANPLIIKTKHINVDSIEKQQNFGILPQQPILLQGNSKVQHENLSNTITQEHMKKTFLNITVPDQKETIFPVALKPSDSNDFEYVKLLNDNSVNENEIQILGI